MAPALEAAALEAAALDAAAEEALEAAAELTAALEAEEAAALEASDDDDELALEVTGAALSLPPPQPVKNPAVASINTHNV